MITSKLVRNLFSLCLIALLGASAAACGDNNGDNGGGSLTPQETTDEINKLFGDSLCDAYYNCPEEQDPNSTLFASRYETEDACSDNILSAFGAAPDDSLQRDIDAGLTEFDGAKAKECIDAFKEQLDADACTTIFSPLLDEPAACEEAVQGTQPNGAACDSDDHCASGYCDTDVDTGDVCWGGECADEPTVTQLGEGDACIGVDGECDSSQDLVCDVDTNGEDFVCVKVDSRAEGDACSSASVCQSGLACADDTCVTLQLGAEGDGCDLQSSFCQPGLICKVNSVSQQGLDASCAAPIDQGGECFLDVSCKDGLRCAGSDIASGTAGTCDTPLGEGEECDSNIDCQEGLTCNFEDVCEAQEEDPYCEVPTEM